MDHGSASPVRAESLRAWPGVSQFFFGSILRNILFKVIWVVILKISSTTIGVLIYYETRKSNLIKPRQASSKSQLHESKPGAVALLTQIYTRATSNTNLLELSK